MNINLKKLTTPIASGGEGSIYVHPDNSSEVVKIYHTPKRIDYQDKLRELFSLPENLFIRPREIYTDKDQVIGFSMKYVNLNEYFLLNKLFNKPFCTQNGFDRDFKVKVLEKIRLAIMEAHNKGFFIGDLNPYNLFFNSHGDVLFSDVDSYQRKDVPEPIVLLEDIQDFINTQLSELTDAWSYDILAFWTLSFVHPFKWVSKDKTVPSRLDERVRKGLSIISSIPQLITPAIYSPLGSDLEDQYKEIFKGRRYMVSLSGSVTNKVPANIPVKVSMQSTSLTIKLIGEGDKFVFCKNMFAFQETFFSDTWKIMKAVSPGFCAVQASRRAYSMYVSADNFAYIDGGKLYNSKDDTSYFKKNGSVFYSNGTLINLADGAIHLYDINSQLQGIYCARYEAYTPSIAIRDAAIQTFSQHKKVILCAEGTTLIQYDVPNTIKNAYVSGNYACIEHLESNRTMYAMFRKSGTRMEKLFEVSSLVYFTTDEQKDLIFIPDNHTIHVYAGVSKVAELDTPVCTEQSVLHKTIAGILLFENKSLYILNTIN